MNKEPELTLEEFLGAEIRFGGTMTHFTFDARIVGSNKIPPQEKDVLLNCLMASMISEQATTAYLIGHSTQTLHSIRKAIAWLCEAGFIKKITDRSANGRIKRITYMVYESPNQPQQKQSPSPVGKKPTGQSEPCGQKADRAQDNENNDLSPNDDEKNESAPERINKNKNNLNKLNKSFSKNDVKEQNPESSKETEDSEVSKKNLLSSKSINLSDQRLIDKTKSIFDFWNNCGKPIIKHRDVSFDGKMISAIATILKKYGEEDLKNRILRYKALLENPDFILFPGITGTRVGLLSFLMGFNEWELDAIFHKNKDLKGVTSWVIECANDKSIQKWLTKVVKPEDPRLAEMLKIVFTRRILKSLPTTLTLKEQSQINQGSNDLLKMYKQVYKTFIAPVGLEEFVEEFVTAVEEAFSGGTISTGNLCSKYSFERIMPTYMAKIGMTRR
jgi:hypothetical protein